MSKIQVRNLETPMEELSEDMTNSIQGGSLFSDIFDLVDETFDEATKIIQEILDFVFG